MRSGRSSLLLLLLLGACSSGGGTTVDASDGGADGAVADGGVDAASGPDVGIAVDAVTCAPACGAGQFCGAGSGTCVSAVVALSLGKGHTCAVHQDRRGSCWGVG